MGHRGLPSLPAFFSLRGIEERNLSSARLLPAGWRLVQLRPESFARLRLAEVGPPPRAPLLCSSKHFKLRALRGTTFQSTNWPYVAATTLNVRYTSRQWPRPRSPKRRRTQQKSLKATYSNLRNISLDLEQFEYSKDLRNLECLLAAKLRAFTLGVFRRSGTRSSGCEDPATLNIGSVFGPPEIYKVPCG